MSPEQIQELRPEISAACEDAVDVWNAIGGWFPERVPFAVDALGVTTIDGLFERLMTIRDVVNEPRDG